MTPFVRFQRGAGRAPLECWAIIVPDSPIKTLELPGIEGPGTEGRIKRATKVIGGQRVISHGRCVDHRFGVPCPLELAS